MTLVAVRPPANAGDTGDTRWLDLQVGKTPWRRKCQPTPVFSPGELMDRGAWRATVHGVTKRRTRLSNSACVHPPADSQSQLSPGACELCPKVSSCRCLKDASWRGSVSDFCHVQSQIPDFLPVRSLFLPWSSP